MTKEAPHKLLIVGATLVLPGSGQLIAGRKRFGIALLFFALFSYTLILLNLSKLIGYIVNGSGDEFIAALAVLLIALTVWTIALRNILRPRKMTSAGKRLSPLRLSIKKFAENDLALIALYVIVLMYILAIIAPVVSSFDPNDISNVLERRYLAPSLAHPFGTDEFGRDLFSRALYGARISLSVGLLAVAVAISIGTIYGGVSGYFGGLIDSVLMRVVDVVISIPTFFVMLLLVGIFEVNIPLLVAILGMTSWLGTARLIRGEFLSLRKTEYAEAARAMGLSDIRIILRHLIPNALSPVLVSAALMVGGMISAEAGLSFLGIGIQPPTPSWGNMLRDGSDSLWIAWWIAFFPGALLALTVLCFNLIADGLRDAFDPKSLMRKIV